MLELNELLERLEREARKVIHFFENQLTKLNTGRANPKLVSEIKIEYYDSPTPIEQLASISLLGPLQIGIKPYELRLLKDIERALVEANLPITVSSDSTTVRVNFPPMTTERRKEMVKSLHALTEQARVALRQIRSRLNKDVKNLVSSEEEQRRYLNKIQEKLNRLIEGVEEISQKREAELLKV